MARSRSRSGRGLGHAIELLSHLVALAQREVTCADGLLVGLRGLVARGERYCQAIDGRVAPAQRRGRLDLDAVLTLELGAQPLDLALREGTRRALRLTRLRSRGRRFSTKRLPLRLGGCLHPVADSQSASRIMATTDPVEGQPSRRAPPQVVPRRSSRLGPALITAAHTPPKPGAGSATVMSAPFRCSSMLPGYSPCKFDWEQPASHSSPSCAAQGLCLPSSASAR